MLALLKTQKGGKEDPFFFIIFKRSPTNFANYVRRTYIVYRTRTILINFQGVP